MKNFIVLLALFTSSQFTQADTFSYKFNKFLVGSGTLKYEIHETLSPVASYTIKSETKIYLLGALKKEVQQISLNRVDLTPIYNSYCSYPKAKNSKFDCSTFTFAPNGQFSHYGLGGSSLNKEHALENFVEKVDRDIRDDFSEFNDLDKVYDLASFIMLPRFFNMNTLVDTDFYVVLENTRIKISIKIANHKRGMKKLIISPAAGTPKHVRNQLPSFIVYDPKRRVVTQVELPSPLGKITVKLDKKSSNYKSLGLF